MSEKLNSLKSMSLKCAGLLAIALMSTARPAAAEEPMSTAITYQGELINGGVPVDEPLDGCDFKFTLWDDEVAGSQVGSTLPVTVSVSRGAFSLTLDFGADIFTGDARFLEVAVCCPAPCGDFTTLAPRQELTPAPYSLHTPSAESVPWSGLTDVPAGFADDVDDDTLGALFCANGEVAKWDGATWVCAEDIDTDTDTTYDGTDFALSNQSCAPGDVVTGVDAAGIVICDPDADTDILGTLSCVDGEIAKWDIALAQWECAADDTGPGDGHSLDASDGDPVDALFVNAEGNVGIGTTDPQVSLQINGGLEIPQIAVSHSTDGGFVVVWIDSEGKASFGLANSMLESYPASTLTIDTDGEFGIGIATPSEKLDVAGNIRSSNSLTISGATDTITASSGTISFDDENLVTLGTITSGDFITIDGAAKTITSNGNLEFHVGDGRVLRLETNAASPNLIGGYSENSVTAGVEGATIAGGGQSAKINSVTDHFGTVGGGDSNQAGDNLGFPSDASFATVGGGRLNTASDIFTTVGGGGINIASGHGSTVGGGQNNIASGNWATVGGGGGQYAMWFDGNTASGHLSTVGGGQLNTASGAQSTVGGGLGNTASGNDSTVGGGRGNVVSVPYGTIAGGGESTPGASTTANFVLDDYGTVGGGGNNKAGNDDANPNTAIYATVGGGGSNTAGGRFSTVGGGYGNVVSGDYGTIAGGGESTPLTPTTANFVFDDYGTVGGGGSNKAGSDDADPLTDRFATVGGGLGNTASSFYATVGGGQANTASGSRSTVPGGNLNSAVGEYSFAAGRRAKANHDGAFVWADSTASFFASTANNQFNVRAGGGTRIFSNSAATVGVELAAGAGSWSSLSDRNAKANVRPVDGRAVLDKLARVPVATWNYKAQDESIRHIGPMAQDFAAAFGVGEKDTMITTIDADGVALAAIQGLHEMVKEQQERIAALEKKLAELTAKKDK